MLMEVLLVGLSLFASATTCLSSKIQTITCSNTRNSTQYSRLKLGLAILQVNNHKRTNPGALTYLTIRMPKYLLDINCMELQDNKFMV